MLALVAVGLLWRGVRYGLAFPIWGDEAFIACNFLTRDFRGLIRPLEYGQFAPLLFMWLELAVVRVAGFSEYALRLLPFACGVLSLLLFARFCRRTLDGPSGMLAAGTFAASYYLVRHGAEIKPYAGDLLWSVVLMSLAWEVYVQPRARRWWPALLAAAAVTPWFSYPAVFVAGAAGLLLAVRALRERSPGFLAGMAGYGLLLGLGFLAMYLAYARPQRSAAEWITDLPTWKAAFPPLRQPWRLPLWLLDVHTGNMFAYPAGGKNGGSAGTFILVLIGCMAAWRQPGRRGILVLLLAPFAFNFIAAALGKYPYGTSARISLYAAPAICWLAGAGLGALLDRLPRAASKGAYRLAAIGLVVIALAGLAQDIARPFKTPADRDNRRVLQTLAKETRPTDRWVVFNSEADGTFGPYIGDSAGFGARFRFYVHTLAPVETTWGIDPAGVESKPGGSIWLLAYEWDLAPAPAGMLDRYVAALIARFGPAEEKQYVLDKSERIRVYRFKQG